MKKKYRIIIFVISIAVLFSGISIWAWWNDLEYGDVVPTSILFFWNIEVSDTSVQLSGSSSNSAFVFSGYDYTLDGDGLYIEIRNSLVASQEATGNFDIIIDLNEQMDQVNYIFVKGNQEDDKKLVWERRK